MVHKELRLHREDGRPVEHLRADVLVRPVDGDRIRHVHDVPAAVKPGGVCDSDGIADHLAEALRVTMEGECTRVSCGGGASKQCFFFLLGVACEHEGGVA